MRKSPGSYPSLGVGATAKRVVAQAGAALLAATAGKVGLDRELSTALRPWMRPLAVHDPGKVLLDLAISVAIGGGLPRGSYNRRSRNFESSLTFRDLFRRRSVGGARSTAQRQRT